MQGNVDYASLIPAEPPEGLMRFLQQEGFFTRGMLTYRRIGKAEADARLDCHEFGGDFRPAEQGGAAAGGRGFAALLWCSECGREAVAGYIPGKRCGMNSTPSGIMLGYDELEEYATCQDGKEMICPMCGEPVTLMSPSRTQYSRKEEVLVMALTVAKAPDRRLPVFTVWNVCRQIIGRRRSVLYRPYFAYVADGKRIIKLAQYRRSFYNWYPIGHWKQLRQAVDTITCPYFFDQFPDLEGTVLENAKLPEYYAQSYEKNGFFPIQYTRLYLRHPNIENLVMAGMGRMVGTAIRKEVVDTYGRSQRNARLAWIDWKAARPAKMLGLTRQQLRQIRAENWGAEKLMAWRACAGKMRFEDAAEAMRLTGAEEVRQMLENGEDPLRTARYLHKQGQPYYFLQDYRRMARQAGLDLEEEAQRRPPHLRQAHDRLVEETRYKTNRELRDRFARMSERCRALSWEHDGICIRPAATPEELVQEGSVLHHCVGGYAQNHASGSIILFIRHARRPERSWFTLNVDVHSKKRIQLHGYGNERSPKGERLKIPKKVQEFVALWEKEVLGPWRLPAERKPKKKKGGRAA